MYLDEYIVFCIAVYSFSFFDIVVLMKSVQDCIYIISQETSRRLVNLSVSRVVAVSPQMRLVEDNVSSLSLLDIYKLRCAKRQLEPDTPVTRYYERLAAVQV